MNWFSYRRFLAILGKELVQMRRDRMTFGMMVGIPVAQLLMFGYAINTDPKHLPTAIIAAEQGPLVRRIESALALSEYFQFVGQLPDQQAGHAALQRGDVQYVLHIPVNFERDLLRGERPAILLEADASDPVTIASATAAANGLQAVLASELRGPVQHLNASPAPFEMRIHRRYNPEGITQYNIVPGLLGVILTMTMIMQTGIALVRERERGTMENLLAMPARPLEIMLGKLSPFIGIAFIQTGVTLLMAHYLFRVPFVGSYSLLFLAVLVFALANLAIGMLFSTIARTQMQAMQMTFFWFLPSILLGGFMFPFRGMPAWAQVLGECLPLTHFLRVARALFLKGASFAELLPNLWPILLFMLIALSFSAYRFRQTLD